MWRIVNNRKYRGLSLHTVHESLWDGWPEMKGASVFVKPNLVSPMSRWDFPSTTRVQVVKLVLQKIVASGAERIIVGECGFKGQWEQTLRSTGYDGLVKDFPTVEIVPLQDGENFRKFTLVRLDKYRSLFGARFSNYMLESDMVINVPKLKVHCLAGITGAIKNMMGTMVQKGSMHPRANAQILQERLADLYELTRSKVKFIVMDGIEGSEYAEQCGQSVRSGILLSGTDQWEVDVAAARLMGFQPEQIPYLRYTLQRIQERDREFYGSNSYKRQDFDSVQVPEYLVKHYERPLNWK